MNLSILFLYRWIRSQAGTEEKAQLVTGPRLLRNKLAKPGLEYMSQQPDQFMNHFEQEVKRYGLKSPIDEKVTKEENLVTTRIRLLISGWNRGPEIVYV